MQVVSGYGAPVLEVRKKTNDGACDRCLQWMLRPVDYGRLLEVLRSLEKSWEVLRSLEKSWEVLRSLEKSWEVLRSLEKSWEVLRSLEKSWEVLRSLEKSWEVLRSLEKSWEVLRSLEKSWVLRWQIPRTAFAMRLEVGTALASSLGSIEICCFQNGWDYLG